VPLQFAIHLAAHRLNDRDPVRPCLTTALRPADLDAGGRPLVRLPHLVATGSTSTGGGVVDTVVWEVMTGQQAARWLGAAVPEQAACFEERLPGLLALRRQARTGDLPSSHAGRALVSLLQERYLSIRLVYTHPALFYELLGDLEAQP
jgi:hypothetical protein